MWLSSNSLGVGGMLPSEVNNFFLGHMQQLIVSVGVLSVTLPTKTLCL